MSSSSELETQNPSAAPPSSAAQQQDHPWTNIDSSAQLATSATATTAAAGDDEEFTLHFDDAVYKRIRALESFRIPLPNCLARCCSCFLDEQTGTAGVVVPPDTWFVITILLFILPFLWSLFIPLATLRPPAEVFITSCGLANVTGFETPESFAPLNYSYCLECNHDSPRILTKINLADAYVRSVAPNMGIIFMMIYSPLVMMNTYRQLSYRVARNELLLAYGVFLKPIAFRHSSWRGVAFYSAVASTGALIVNLAVLSSDIMRSFKREMRMGDGSAGAAADGPSESSICGGGKYKGWPLYFSVGNFDTSLSHQLLPAALLGQVLIFVPALLKIWRLSRAPLNNLHAEDVLDVITKQQQQQQQPEQMQRSHKQEQDCHNFASRLRVLEEADFHRAVLLYKIRLRDADSSCSMYLMPSFLTCGIKWATTVGEIQTIVRMAHAVTEQRHQLIMPVGALWDWEIARDYVNAKVFGGPLPDPPVLGSSGGSGSTTENNVQEPDGVHTSLVAKSSKDTQQKEEEEEKKKKKKKKYQNDPGLY